MKKVLEIVAIALLAAVVAVLCIVIGNKISGGKLIPTVYDSSVQIAQTETNSVITLNSLNSVLEYKQFILEEQYNDSVFTSIPDPVLTHIVTVLLKKAPDCTIEDIVKEYMINRSIYDNLPPPASSTANTNTENAPLASITIEQEGKTTVTEAPPTRVGDEKSPASDTTINGKKYKLVELYEERSDHRL